MQGIIEATKPSKSGKTLGVKINGQWLSSKHFELAQHQNEEITYTTSVQTFPDGNSMTWLNDYTLAGSQPTTADQAFQAAYAQANQAAPVAPQAPQTNREASIVAQALTKAVSAPGDDPSKVWATYCTLYRKALGGVPDSQPAAPKPQASSDFDDDLSGIPF